MALAPEDLPSGAMPEEAPQFGAGTEMARQRKALQSAGTPGATMQPPPGAAGIAAGSQPGGAPSPPVQPAPRQPLTWDDLQPGGPVFSEPRLRPAYPWRQEMRMWSSHPDSGPLLAQLSRRADAGLHREQP